MKACMSLFLTGLFVILAGAMWAPHAAAQDLLGSTRTQMQARFGHPMFSPRLGDEDETEDFHVGAWRYIMGYRADKTDPHNNDKMKDKVAASVSGALAAGARGTPHTFVIVGDQKTTIDGAQPYPVVKQLLDTILAQLDGTPVPKAAAK